MKEKKNVYDFFKTIYNNLNNAINAVNHVKCKLKCDTVKHK